MSSGTDFAKELDIYRRRCLELEEKNKKDEMRCLMLEVEVGDLRRKKEELEGQITRIQKTVDNREKGKGMIVDLMDEEDDGDKFLQLMIENKVLECEKTKAETDLRCCKEKVKQLELRVFELESKAIMKCKDESTFGIDDVKVMLTPKTHLDKNDILIDVEKAKEDGYPNTKLAPSTPGVARPPVFGVIDISDEDVNYIEIRKVKKLSDSGDCGDLSNKNEIERTNVKHFDEEDMDGFEMHDRIAKRFKRKRASSMITSDDEKSNKDEEDMDVFKSNPPDTIGAKRKRAAAMVTSDSDTSDDDNALICTLMTRNSSRLSTDSEAEGNDGRRQRLTRLRKLESRNKQDKSTFDLNRTVCLYENSSSEGEGDSDGVVEGSESECDSMGGFIVESSESDSDLASGSGNSCDDESDALDDFKLTLDKIQRKRASNLKWDLEGDMLADFGKDPELCMRAVCALYRQQTMDEKASKGTIHQNERGFSHTDAFRGSKLAEFLTDGDSSGDLNKTVEELKQYNTKGIKLCTTLATKYSKQLFAIYQNKEDPYFLPQ